jgi:signal transduction histidine kinase
MLDPRHWSLGAKLPLTLGLVVVAVSLTIGMVMVIQERGRIRADLEQRAMQQAYSVAANAAEATLRSDYWALFKILEQATRGGEGGQMVTGVILDKSGVVMAALHPRAFPIGLHMASADPAERTRIRNLIEARQPRSNWGSVGDGGPFVEAAYPIEAGQNVTGLVLLRLSAAEIASRTRTAAFTILGITAALAAVGSAVGATISNRMIRPLRELAAAMDHIAEDSRRVPQVTIRDFDEIGRLVQAFQGMAQGLAEKRELERELATAEKLAALGGIAAGVAHEVNNPLAGMLNCIDTLEKYPDDPTLLPRYIPMIKKGLHRIHSIVRGLLAELRIEDDGQWGCGDCLDDIRELVLVETQGRAVTLDWSNGLGCDTQLQCRRIQQVVFNLLKNAIQAVNDGGRVAFRALPGGGGGAVFEVEDDGVGIPPEHLSRIFDPFFTEKASGTGLGLWITYRLVQSMGGTIEVESEPGLGSLFRVRLPDTRGLVQSDAQSATSTL